MKSKKKIIKKATQGVKSASSASDKTLGQTLKGKKKLSGSEKPKLEKKASNKFKMKSSAEPEVPEAPEVPEVIVKEASLSCVLDHPVSEVQDELKKEAPAAPVPEVQDDLKKEAPAAPVPEVQDDSHIVWQSVTGSQIPSVVDEDTWDGFPKHLFREVPGEEIEKPAPKKGLLSRLWKRAKDAFSALMLRLEGSKLSIFTSAGAGVLAWVLLKGVISGFLLYSIIVAVILADFFISKWIISRLSSS